MFIVSKVTKVNLNETTTLAVLIPFFKYSGFIGFLVVNTNSIRSKQAELETLIHTLKPDAIIMTETKLGNEHDTSEFLPKKLRYKVHRNDKRSDCGGVLIAVKECYNQNEVYNDWSGGMGRGKLEGPKENVHWCFLPPTRLF
jgi:hypothetical protein